MCFMGLQKKQLRLFCTKPLISSLVSSQLDLYSYKGLKQRLQSQVLSYGMQKHHYSLMQALGITAFPCCRL